MLQVQTQRSQQVACNTIEMPQPTCPLMGLLTLVPVACGCSQSTMRSDMKLAAWTSPLLHATLGPAGDHGNGGGLAFACSHVRAPGGEPIQVSTGRLPLAVTTCIDSADIYIQCLLAAGRLPLLLLVSNTLHVALTHLCYLCMWA